MALDPITSWQLERENVEVVTDFLFLGSKILQLVTVAMKSEDDCFMAGKLLTNLDSVFQKETPLCLQSQGYGQGCIVKAMVFPVVRNGPSEGRTPSN